MRLHGDSRGVAIVSALPGFGCVHPGTGRLPPSQRFSPTDFLPTGAAPGLLLSLPASVCRAADQKILFVMLRATSLQVEDGGAARKRPGRAVGQSRGAMQGEDSRQASLRARHRTAAD